MREEGCPEGWFKVHPNRGYGVIKLKKAGQSAGKGGRGGGGAREKYPEFDDQWTLYGSMTILSGTSGRTAERTRKKKKQERTKRDGWGKGRRENGSKS